MDDMSLNQILRNHKLWLDSEEGSGSRADLQGADLRGANLQIADLREVNLRGADLQRADLQRADLQRADLQGADLQGADLRGADLREVNLLEADLQRADLQRADLREVNLRGADLREVNLRGADLQGADLQRADLQRADLQGADLQKANLSRADLSGADLSRADLQEADLQRSSFRDTVFRKADLRGANIQNAGFPEADLRGVDLSTLGFKIPIIPNIDQTILNTLDNSQNHLDMSNWHNDWHFCDTVHCRAGWAIVLADKAGRELENQLGTDAAAALIYAASGSHPVPDWFGTNEEAMEDMRKRAQYSQKGGQFVGNLPLSVESSERDPSELENSASAIRSEPSTSPTLDTPPK